MFTSKNRRRFLPLLNDYKEETHEFLSTEIELTNYFKDKKYKGNGATGGIDMEDVKNISAILLHWRINEFIEIDLTKLKESHEAWIHIKIDTTKRTDLVKEFGNSPLKGILTWSNSD